MTPEETALLTADPLKLVTELNRDEFHRAVRLILGASCNSVLSTSFVSFLSLALSVAWIKITMELEFKLFNTSNTRITPVRDHISKTG